MDVIFNREKLISLLKKIDSELAKKAKIFVIGGSAACLAYNSKTGTRDIDTWNDELAVRQAYEKIVKKHLDLRIPLAEVKVLIESLAMRKRFKKFPLADLNRLEIFVPEAEDLFIMKAQRADEKDVDDLQSLNKEKKLDHGLIVERFIEEILPSNRGSDALLEEKFLLCIEEVFGSKIADNVYRKLDL